MYIESLIFAAPEPVTLSDIKLSLESSFEVKLKKSDIEKSIHELIAKYQKEEYAIEIVAINYGYQFMSKPFYHHVIGNLVKVQSNKKLSKAAIETLSIIAYKQPVTKTMIESIRGVSCGYTIQKLLEKELCEIVGRDDGPGRPLLYATSAKFMNYFGLKDIKDLPHLKEVDPDEENSIGNSDQKSGDFQAVIPLDDE